MEHFKYTLGRRVTHGVSAFIHLVCRSLSETKVSSLHLFGARKESWETCSHLFQLDMLKVIFFSASLRSGILRWACKDACCVSLLNICLINLVRSSFFLFPFSLSHGVDVYQVITEKDPYLGVIQYWFNREEERFALQNGLTGSSRDDPSPQWIIYYSKRERLCLNIMSLWGHVFLPPKKHKARDRHQGGGGIFIHAAPSFDCGKERQKGLVHRSLFISTA